MEDVFPAQAGVILGAYLLAGGGLRLSRASGGDPGRCFRITRHKTSFPRKRG